MVISILLIYLILFIFHITHGANQIIIRQKIYQLPLDVKNIGNKKILEKEKSHNKNMIISDVRDKNILEKETSHNRTTDVKLEKDVTLTHDNINRTVDNNHDSVDQLPTVNHTTEATTVNKILQVYRFIAQCSSSPQYRQAITSINLPQIDLSWREYVEEVYNQYNQSISSEYIAVIHTM